MFGSATQKVLKTKSSLPALQELPSHQKNLGNRMEATKNLGCWSGVRKFKVNIEKSQEANSKSGTTGREERRQDRAKDYRPIQNEQPRTQNGGE